jgi:hypothetical protein
VLEMMSNSLMYVASAGHLVYTHACLYLQWITIHVRHRDFSGWCHDIPSYDCFAKLPVIARRVQEIKDELYEKRGITVDHVIMTSDEDNATWWQDVVEQGWKRVDYSNIASSFGGWSVVMMIARLKPHDTVSTGIQC